jgi:hypothetical protein
MKQLSFDELLVVGRNKKGILYLYQWDTGEIVAKQCTGCGEWHFVNGFNKAGKGFAGSHSLCKKCHKGRNAEWRFDKKANDELNLQVSMELDRLRKAREERYDYNERLMF